MLIAYALVIITMVVAGYGLMQNRNLKKQLESNLKIINNLELLLDRWISRWDEEKEKHDILVKELNKEITHLKKKVKNLEYIIGKVDGSVIERDKETKEIKHIRRII